MRIDEKLCFTTTLLHSMPAYVLYTVTDRKDNSMYCTVEKVKTKQLTSVYVHASQTAPVPLIEAPSTPPVGLALSL